jgi:uncharacterized protein (TIRG00374 family)
MSGRRILAVFIGISIIILLVVLAKPVKVLESLGRVNLYLLVSAVLVYLLSWLLRVARLQTMVHSLSCAESLGFTAAFRVYIASFAINSIFPLKLGDAAMVGFLKRFGVDTSKGVAIVIKGRVLDVIALVILLLLPLLFYRFDNKLVSPIVNAAAASIAIVSAVMLLFVLLRTSLIPRIFKIVDRGKEHRRIHSLLAKIESISEHFLEMLKAPGTMLLCALLSLGIWFSEGLVYYTLLSGMAEKPTLLPVISAIMIANLGKGVPGIPGGVGVYEGVASSFVASFGIPFQTCLAAAIIDHLIKKTVNLGAGVPAALSMGYSFKRRDV